MTFTQIARQSLLDFSSLLQRYFDNDERENIRKLVGLNDLNSDANIEIKDTTLLNMLQHIKRLLNKKVKDYPKSYYSYSGIEQYMQFLEDFLGQYCII